MGLLPLLLPVPEPDVSDPDGGVSEPVLDPLDPLDPVPMPPLLESDVPVPDGEPVPVDVPV